MEEYVLFVHPYCVSSIRVLVYLHQEYHGPPIGLSIRVLTDKYTPFTKLLVPSLPALASDDNMIAIDPLEPELLVAILENETETIHKYVPKNGEEAVKRYTESIIASSYLMLKTLLDPDLPHRLVNTEFYDYALRTILAGTKDFRNYVEKNIEKIILEANKYAPKITALNYLRDIFLVGGQGIRRGDVLDVKKIMLWMNAKNSIGRAYMSENTVYNDKTFIEASLRILGILENKFDKYMDKIIQEYEYIESNKYIFSENINRLTIR